jgi:hypothetical protein
MTDFMLDPSLLSPARLETVTEVVERLRSEGSTPYVSGTFYELVRERAISFAAFDALQGRRIRRGPTLIGSENGRRELKLRYEISAVRDWIITSEVLPYQPSFVEAELAGAVPVEVRHENPEVARVLADEWAFLQAHSIVGSRIKKPFNVFIRGGAVAIEGGMRHLQQLEMRTLRLHPDTHAELSVLQHLRVVAKWLAAGGAPASALVEPLLGVAASAGAGWFLLLDP